MAPPASGPASPAGGPGETLSTLSLVNKRAQVGQLSLLRCFDVDRSAEATAATGGLLPLGASDGFQTPAPATAASLAKSSTTSGSGGFTVGQLYLRRDLLCGFHLCGTCYQVSAAGTGSTARVVIPTVQAIQAFFFNFWSDNNNMADHYYVSQTALRIIENLLGSSERDSIIKMALNSPGSMSFYPNEMSVFTHPKVADTDRLLDHFGTGTDSSPTLPSDIFCAVATIALAGFLQEHLNANRKSTVEVTIVHTEAELPLLEMAIQVAGTRPALALLPLETYVQERLGLSTDVIARLPDGSKTLPASKTGADPIIYYPPYWSPGQLDQFAGFTATGTLSVSANRSRSVATVDLSARDYERLRHLSIAPSAGQREILARMPVGLVRTGAESLASDLTVSSAERAGSDAPPREGENDEDVAVDEIESDSSHMRFLIVGMDFRNRALHGDRVIIAPLPRAEWLELEQVACPRLRGYLTRYRGLPQARVVGIAARSRVPLTAVLKPASGSFGHEVHLGTKVFQAVPADRRLPVMNVCLAGARATRLLEAPGGHRFVLTVSSWPVTSRLPNALFVRELGPSHTKSSRLLALLTEYGLLHESHFEALASLGSEEDMYGPLRDIAQLLGSQSSVHDRDVLHADGRLALSSDIGDSFGCAQRWDMTSLLDPFCIDPPGCTDIDDSLSVRLVTAIPRVSCQPVAGRPDSEQILYAGPLGELVPTYAGSVPEVTRWSDAEGANVRGLHTDQREGLLVEMGVHISDVTSMILSDSPLDLHARIRTATIYFQDFSLPMLPRVLSSGLLSQLPGQTRPAFSSFFYFRLQDLAPLRRDPPRAGELLPVLRPVAVRFARTRIASRMSFSYGEAQQVVSQYFARADPKAIAVQPDDRTYLPADRPFRPAERLAPPAGVAPGDTRPEQRTSVLNALLLMMRLYRQLSATRARLGGLQLSAIPLKFEVKSRAAMADMLSDETSLDGVSQESENELERLIAEFMIFTNCQVAEYISGAFARMGGRMGGSLVRVHRFQTQTENAGLAAALRALGYDIDGRTATAFSFMFTDLQQRLRDSHQEDAPSILAVLGQLALTRFLPAEYVDSSAPEFSAAAAGKKKRPDGEEDPLGPFGHFGLGVRMYTHFTAPIRRYPDIIVHRQLLAAMVISAGSLAAGIPPAEPLPESLAVGLLEREPLLRECLSSSRQVRFTEPAPDATGPTEEADGIVKASTGVTKSGPEAVVAFGSNQLHLFAQFLNEKSKAIKYAGFESRRLEMALFLQDLLKRYGRIVLPAVISRFVANDDTDSPALNHIQLSIPSLGISDRLSLPLVDGVPSVVLGPGGAGARPLSEWVLSADTARLAPRDPGAGRGLQVLDWVLVSVGFSARETAGGSPAAKGLDAPQRPTGEEGALVEVDLGSVVRPVPRPYFTLVGRLDDASRSLISRVPELGQTSDLATVQRVCGARVADKAEAAPPAPAGLPGPAVVVQAPLASDRPTLSRTKRRKEAALSSAASNSVYATLRQLHQALDQTRVFHSAFAAPGLSQTALPSEAQVEEEAPEPADG
ncbi:hypothetical protein H696_03964 [Fonticula alba]|uniref:DIS3-like exonuclease 1 n=1 Tax=Fonticula alba TaxID=691883 RepID=A0A058Z6K9_FONAL|nr:hypothetical protein H696_03964 [Fonticula alba]KCV69543.1 hypothetical protein H696_03964 [Fonticula alba]|eukprot:XP_009496108.1 hypothetical protein H696_03964 [Fonticula alba]